MWNNSLQGTGHEAMKDSDAWEMSLSIIPDDCLGMVSDHSTKGLFRKRRQRWEPEDTVAKADTIEDQRG